MILGVVLLVAGLVPIAVAGVRFWRNATPGERKAVVTMIAAVVCLFAVLAHADHDEPVRRLGAADRRRR